MGEKIETEETAGIAGKEIITEEIVGKEKGHAVGTEMEESHSLIGKTHREAIPKQSM